MMTSILLFTGAACALCLAGCAMPHGTPTSKEPFATTPDGKAVYVYTLRNSKGAEARILNYGGIVISLTMPDKSGKMGDVVLGHNDFPMYITNSTYFGALIGRYGNRIANGKFSLDGKTYTLAQNNNQNSLHGGIKGFDKVIWDVTPMETKNGPALQMTYLSKDGEEGFPGNLNVTAVYTLTDDNALRVDFTATTDKPTICNLTHHSYFNLEGGAGDILNYEVMINGDKFTPVDATLIPTGVLQPVQGTVFDFTTPTKIGARINNDDEQLKRGGGYDHNWVLNKKAGDLSLAARVTDANSGRVLEVWTTEPGLQFYTGNFIGDMPGKYGQTYHNRSGFAMEPQTYPDAPNHPDFPSCTLRPGETYHNTIIYKFSTL